MLDNETETFWSELKKEIKKENKKFNLVCNALGYVFIGTYVVAVIIAWCMGAYKNDIMNFGRGIAIDITLIAICSFCALYWIVAMTHILIKLIGRRRKNGR